MEWKLEDLRINSTNTFDYLRDPVVFLKAMPDEGLIWHFTHKDVLKRPSWFSRINTKISLISIPVEYIPRLFCGSVESTLRFF